jgi:hypothetical protein
LQGTGLIGKFSARAQEISISDSTSTCSQDNDVFLLGDKIWFQRVTLNGCHSNSVHFNILEAQELRIRNCTGTHFFINSGEYVSVNITDSEFSGNSFESLFRMTTGSLVGNTNFTIARTIFQQNDVMTHFQFWQFCVTDPQTVNFVETTFSENNFTYGGVVQFGWRETWGCHNDTILWTVLLDNCLLKNNTGHAGGILWTQEGPSGPILGPMAAVFTQSTNFSGNSVKYGLIRATSQFRPILISPTCTTIFRNFSAVVGLEDFYGQRLTFLPWDSLSGNEIFLREHDLPEKKTFVNPGNASAQFWVLGTGSTLARTFLLSYPPLQSSSYQVSVQPYRCDPGYQIMVQKKSNSSHFPFRKATPTHSRAARATTDFILLGIIVFLARLSDRL